jgi:hypothetical protein
MSFATLSLALSSLERFGNGRASASFLARGRGITIPELPTTQAAANVEAEACWSFFHTFTKAIAIQC